MKRNYVDVYGFGSYFSGDNQFSDIDIAIIHNHRTIESCAMAISCKRTILNFNSKFHITMLSTEAEKSFNFLAKANARHIERIAESIDLASIEKIIVKIAAIHPGTQFKYSLNGA
jgi:Nucleotidyltransferase domain